MRLLIADLVTELEPRYENTKRLAEPFRYEGDRPTDIRLTVTDAYLESLMRRAAPNTTEELMENFAFSCDFNRKAIPFQTMLVHSSALVYDGGAYLFSADSGVGKSTHTRLWLQAFGDRVHILNDDKPVVRLSGSTALQRHRQKRDRAAARDRVCRKRRKKRRQGPLLHGGASKNLFSDRAHGQRPNRLPHARKF